MASTSTKKPRRFYPTSRSDAARTAALRLLYQIEVEGSFLDPLLEQLDQSDLDPRDRRFVRQLVFGCLRWRLRLDWIAAQFTRRPVDSLSPWVLQILRLGLYQLHWLDRVPAHAVVDTAVELTKQFVHRGAAGMVNAVLRRSLRERDGIPYPPRQRNLVAHLAILHTHPEWLVTRWLERWGESQPEALLQANNAPAPLYLRLNGPQGENESPKIEGLELKADGPLPGYYAATDGEGFFRSSAFATGRFAIQDINAGLPAALLDPQPGERLLDLCSAPGGKAVQLGAAVGVDGCVVAADLSCQRLRRVRENADRLPLDNIPLLVQDARVPGLRPDLSFPRILVDVPCSATGTLGRNPDARWSRDPDQLPDLFRRQREIISRAFSLLSPGGTLVYSTCSLEREENDDLVERFLKETPDAELEPAEQFFPNRSWAARFIQTLPGREPGDGIFAARIRKRGT